MNEVTNAMTSSICLYFTLGLISQRTWGVSLDKLIGGRGLEFEKSPHPGALLSPWVGGKVPHWERSMSMLLKETSKGLEWWGRDWESGPSWTIYKDHRMELRAQTWPSSRLHNCGIFSSSLGWKSLALACKSRHPSELQFPHLQRGKKSQVVRIQQKNRHEAPSMMPDTQETQSIFIFLPPRLSAGLSQCSLDGRDMGVGTLYRWMLLNTIILNAVDPHYSQFCSVKLPQRLK